MNEEKILALAKPYVKDGTITYYQFENIYKMLSLQEQYEVVEILYKNKIELIPEEELERFDFLQLHDENIFQDEKMEMPLEAKSQVKQRNETLCVLVQQGNKQAEQDLCINNKGLVDAIVISYQKWYRSGLDSEDLKQAGFMGIIEAAKRFDINRDNAFSTYAVFWIKQAISREIMNHGYAIRIPVHMMETINKVAREESKYLGMGTDDRIDKIAEALSMEKELVRECLIKKRDYLSCASLNMIAGEDLDTELGEMIQEEESLSVEDIVGNTLMREQLEEVLDTLTPREEKVLRLRFGLDDGRARSLEEVGNNFGVTRERIRQIEAKALRKLRHPSRSHKLKDFLD